MLLFVLLFVSATAMGGNRIYSPRYLSLTTIVNDNWMDRPVMTLGTSDVLYIGFDELSHTFHRLTYRLEHCEADWTPSEELFESDWLEGFNNNQIEDYQNSINTTVLYTHYDMTIPNDRCRLKMSGNYRLTVFDEDADGERVLSVEFYVVDPQMTVGLEVTTNTDVDLNVSHQQVLMTVNYEQQSVTNTDEQLRWVVMQNWNEETAHHNMRPNYINTRGLAWDHCRDLIFDAGNEYHKYEVLDVSHTTMGLDRISWDGKAYQAYPFTATPRRNYLTDVDADGAFIIRNSDNREIDYTCDYVWVNYTLQSPYQGELYVDGQWATDSNRESYRMRYDAEHELYHKALMHKQGYYNYRFVTADGKLAPAEGSFFQTENRYQALVYYKPTGGRTWLLVGYRGVIFK
jgi:hypothetical protein